MFRVATCLLLAAVLEMSAAVRLADEWRQSVIAPAKMSFEIRGTRERNNPIRRRLLEPFSGEEMFVRYRLRYAADCIDQPDEKTSGEFFVLWLDRVDGGDTASHAGGVPNVGVHVRNGKNNFMLRYSSGAEKHTAVELQGDREYLVVARLWKTKPGQEEPFDALDMWVDPPATAENKPQASARWPRTFSEVKWIGFSTGRKTEVSDQITVSDIDVAETWEEILGLPPKSIEAYRPKPPPVVKKTVDFKQHVYPVLKGHCFKCHEGEKSKGGVRLDIWDEVLNQTAPRNADASHLISLVTHPDPEKRMPPKGRALNEAEIKTLKAWINEGLEWDEELLPTPTPTSDHWAFQSIKRPPVPAVDRLDWVRTPVDAFIARKQEAMGLNPAPMADQRTLDRRYSLDLVGLPPTKADTDVETLLASKQYGERWGRHWLDIARWAESNGHQHNRDRPHAWRYRDYVVRSFNADKPFDQFLREQIAGDELPFDREHLIATGFLAAARYSGNELDKEIQRNDILVDIVNTTGAAFLGLTFECAQCHTHKFDPISLRDYYGLQAFFAQGQPGNIVLDTSREQRELIARRQQIFDGVHARIVRSKRKQGHPEPILVIPKTVERGMRPEEKKRYNELGQKIAKAPQVWGFYSPVTSTNDLDIAAHEMRWPLPGHDLLQYHKTHLLIRGEVTAKGPEIAADVPAVFNAKTEKKGRLALADWLTSPKNPLTARVWVNRIWQWHFGRGLVETSNDFGKHGTKPSHPELLDWLASELIEHDWSTKHIHRLILNSSTFRQSSAWSAGNARLDPDNHYLWRWQPRRLEAEALRDSMLAVAGILDPEKGGPSVSQNAVDSSNRRSLYLQQKRDNLPHQQMLFDGAPAVVSCSRRSISTVASQPLYLLNSVFSQRVSAAFAKRVARKSAKPGLQAAYAIELALQRPPTDDEIAKSAELISSDGLVKFCQALLNLNEFVYLP